MRIVQLVCAKENYDQISNALKGSTVIDSWSVLDFTKQNVVFSVLLTVENSQTFLDSLQAKIDKKIIKKIVVSSAEVILPQQKSPPVTKSKPSKFRITKETQRVPREELYNQLSNSSHLDFDYVLLILLSTIVAALGLLHNQIIAIIAAMVIAPMIEPNLAISFAAVLGDGKLLLKAAKTNLIGIGICLIFSIIIGLIWPYGVETSELLLKRTNVGYTSIILALASGMAAAISLTSRFSSVLVGVMVAVALLPPLVTTGILLSSGNYYQSIGAGLLFIVNIVCINLTANLVFLFKGIRPQKWYEKQKAKVAIFWYLFFWIVSLLALCIAIYFYHNINVHKPLLSRKTESIINQHLLIPS